MTLPRLDESRPRDRPAHGDPAPDRPCLTLACGPAAGGARWLAGPALLHATLPAAVMTVLLAMYFAGGPTLAGLVVPAVNRELGLLEHLQLAVLAATGLMARAAWRREGPGRWRGLLLAVTVGALLLFLEEVNYGQHYFALLTGRGSEAAMGPVSVHNVGGTTEWLKLVGDVGIVLLFVAAPLARALPRLAPVRAYLPGRWYLATAALMLLFGQATHLLAGAGLGPGWLTGNLSEFRELLVYYLGALLTRDLVRARADALADAARRRAVTRAAAAPRAAGRTAAPPAPATRR